jgi:hypothetical protein
MKMLKIRNPFKDKLLRWKDDITPREKIVWYIVFAIIGVIAGRLITDLGLDEYFK